VSTRKFAKHKSLTKAGNMRQDGGGRFLKTGGEERARFTTTLPPSALHALDLLVKAAFQQAGVELQRNEALAILLGAAIDARYREPLALKRFLELAAAWTGWEQGLLPPLPKAPATKSAGSGRSGEKRTRLTNPQGKQVDQILLPWLENGINTASELAQVTAAIADAGLPVQVESTLRTRLRRLGQRRPKDV